MKYVRLKKLRVKLKLKLKKPTIQKILMIPIFCNRRHKVATKSARSYANAGRSGT